MHLFNDYIQPLTYWLQNHPHWALLITFFIALTESLAVIGSIIPGSVTMTAIGILAGSGIMRIDLTFIAAILGAIVGDSFSYLLGYIFKDRLATIWPFNRNPHWLHYGQDYFARHGGKSVLLGRFVGPLRSLIPVIAGMMGMNQWRFLIVNVISGVAWSILYVLPGVMIGAASSELSPEIATRLFILILFFLAGLWFLSISLNWLFIRINRFLRTKLHLVWLWLCDNRYLSKIVKSFTPDDEIQHYPTAGLFFLFILSSLLLGILTFQVNSSSGISNLNEPVFLFLQSLRTHTFDIFFAIISQFANPLTLTTLAVAIACLTLYHGDYRSLAYWLGLNLTCALMLLVFHTSIYSPSPQSWSETNIGNFFPISSLTFNSIFFISCVLYITTYCQLRYRRAIVTFLLTSLLLVGFSFLYLGDYWFTDCVGAYLSSISLSLLFWLFYRCKKPQQLIQHYFIYGTLFLYLLTTTLSCINNYTHLMQRHQPYFAQYVFTDERWWNQTEPLLPIYRTNRIGQPVGLFNLQYAGRLNILEQALIAYGWKKQNDSLFNSIIKRVSGRSTAQDFPLMAQLYLNRKPVLLFTYDPPDGPRQILRIWRSNYHLLHLRQPIWLGSVQPRVLIKKHKQADYKLKTFKPIVSLKYVSLALSSSPALILRNIPLPNKNLPRTLTTKVEPSLLLIKESPSVNLDAHPIHLHEK